MTTSSEEVGWMATQLSQSALVAPILTATPNPCNISSEPMPMICSTTTCRRKHNSHNISCRFTLPHAVEPSETNTTISGRESGRGGGGGGGGGQRNFLNKVCPTTYLGLSMSRKAIIFITHDYIEK